MKCGFLNNDNPTVNLAFWGCFNPTHRNGDDLGMVYYWLYHITGFFFTGVDTIQLAY
jgi:hypothetical protein